MQQRLTLVVACLLLSSEPRPPDASELTKMIKAGRADTGNVFANYSIVCLSPMRIRREMAYLVEQHDSVDGHKWKQCCETNRTTGVPDVSSPVKKHHLCNSVKFMLAVGGLTHYADKCTTLVIMIMCQRNSLVLF